MVDELRAFADRPGHAVVMVTHSPEVAVRCDRVARMRDGVLAEVGSDSSGLDGREAI